MIPYYEHAGITIYHGDWRDFKLPARWGGLLTDPPYGLNEAAGKNKSRTKLAVSKDYGNDTWDADPVSSEDISRVRQWADHHIIFGGNYFYLPPTKCWLVWDKVNGESDFADCELAWTNLPKAVRMYRYMWAGMLKEKPEFRTHPTQKPLSLMLWCLSHFPESVRDVVDPYMGSGTTLVAAKQLGLRCTGFEREERYCEVAAERLRQEVLF